MLPGFTGFYWFLLGHTGFYLVVQGFTGFYWVLLCVTGETDPATNPGFKNIGCDSFIRKI